MRVFILKKAVLIRTVAVVAVLAVAVIAARSVLGSAPASANIAAEPVESAVTEKKAVALTFDTVFGEDQTPAILELLRNSGVKATFAVMGAWAQENADTVRQILADGHEVISHSMVHPRYPELAEADIARDAAAARALLETEFGVTTPYIRPPYGACDDKTLAVLENEGITVVTWSVDSRDWGEDDSSKVAANVTSAIKPGSIVMFQNNRAATVAALGEVLTALEQTGYRCATLSELLNDAE